MLINIFGTKILKIFYLPNNLFLFFYSKFLCLKIYHETAVAITEIISAIRNPTGLVSSPFITFIPNAEVIRVGNISMIVMDVSVRITVFMLLLMML